ncbi:trigger factor [Ignatzschineria cameli]|uniref:Trigger factor n=2 Tax=Ignatzschineria cameli TaxID=2182793 RepID=A0A2U2ATH8_9GAMM|nr:trigger factor [Ignatzschineria cameli]PWD87977.1 trigger factor [Ignatzschineria cameli]PWD91009.1 trigger factor [Ignatzschineria cameli]PWD92651.1 trigger factor [Ignatzschineria cameli]PWD93671.1 trigger factor [Ignatzschineria cameli]
MMSVETLEGLKRRVVIELDAEQVEKDIESRLKELARRVRVDGFRPGKVPVKVVRNMHGAEVENEVIGEAIGKKYQATITELKLEPAGQPVIDRPSEENKYSFTAEFEVMPEVKLDNLDKLEAVKFEAEVTDADLENMLKTLQKQSQTWKESDEAAKVEDRVNINFVGRVDGEEFEGGKADNTPLILGSNSMIPGFEDQIVGMKKGETKTIKVTFPEDYQADHLAGKEAEFDITVNSVEVGELPEIDATFAERFGIADGDVEKLRSELRKNMERELNNVIHNRFKASVLESLEKNHELEVPQVMVVSEAQAMAQQSNFPQPRSQEEANQLMELITQIFSKQAEQKVRLSLLVSKFIEDNKITPDESYVDKRLDLIASTYEDPAEVIEHFKKDQNSMQNIRNIALEDQVVDLLAEKAAVVTEKKTFDELMNQAQR